MSAAKKTARKRVAVPKAGGRRYFGTNPLPEDAVGKNLLVSLHAERIIEHLKLKESWQVPYGWDFEDVCAIVGCASGGKYQSPGDEDRAAKVRARIDPAIRSKVEAIAKPEIVDYVPARSALPTDIYDQILILGLGHPCMPINTSIAEPNGLAGGLAKFLGVEEGRVIERTFERAKRNVWKRYLIHISKQSVRLTMAAERQRRIASSLPAMPHARLLREALGQIVLEGQISLSGGVEDQRVLRQVFVKAGLPFPARRKGKL